MPKQKTNEQVLANILNYSKYGALSNVFVMNAIHSAAKATVDGGVESLPPDGFVSPDAWVGVANEIKTKLESNWGL